MLGFFQGLSLLAGAADAVTGGKSTKAVGKALDGILPDGAVGGFVQQIFDHEKQKASVRPMMMKRTGQVSILIAVAGVVAALSPLFGVEQETSNAIVQNLLLLFAGTGGAYTVQHGIRSYDKGKEGAGS